MTYTGLKFKLTIDSVTVYTVIREPDLTKDVDDCIVTNHQHLRSVVTSFLRRLVKQYPKPYHGYEIIKLPSEMKVSFESINIF